MNVEGSFVNGVQCSHHSWLAGGVLLESNIRMNAPNNNQIDAIQQSIEAGHDIRMKDS
jgi:hypothetical protein